MGDVQIFMFLGRCLLAIALVVATTFVTYAIGCRLLSGERGSVRWCGVIVVGLWLSAAGFHFLAALGIFNVPGSLGLLSLLVTIIRLTGYSFSRFWADLAQDAQRLKILVDIPTSRLQKCCLVFLALGGLFVGARACLLPPLAWDALTYHMVKAGIWVQSGSVWLFESAGLWNGYRCFPGGGEVAQAWAMLPFHGDFLVGLADFLIWLGLMLSLFVLGQSTGLDRATSLVGAVFCGFVPPVIFTVGGGHVDIAWALAIVLGTDFAVLYFLNRRNTFLAFSLMSFGVAASIKYLAYIPVFAALSVIAAGTICVRDRNSESVKALFFSLVLMAVPMVPWLIYNWVATGYPLAPLSAKLGGIELGMTDPAFRWHYEHPEVRAHDVLYEVEGFVLLFTPWVVGALSNRVPDYGVMTMLPLALFPVSVAILTRRSLWVGAVVLSVVLVGFGVYFAPSFTVVRQLFVWGNQRFLFGAVFPAVMIGLIAFRGTRMSQVVLDLMLFVSCLRLASGMWFQWPLFELPYLLSVLICTGLAGGVGYYLVQRVSAKAFSLAMLTMLALWLNGLESARDHIRPAATTKSYFSHFFPHYWAEAATDVDMPQMNRRIAFTGSLEVDRGPWWYIYMFMGRSLQNTLHYVPPTESGRIPYGGPRPFGEDQWSFEAWLRRLQSQAITEVISFYPRSPELEWMESHPEHFQRLRGNVYWGLFRLQTTPDSSKRAP